MADPVIDPKGQSTTTPDPSQSGEGQSQDDIPDQFKGKSASDIAKSYIALEKKLGEQGAEVGQTRQQMAQAKQELDNWNAFAQLVESDPVLFAAVEKKITQAKQIPNQNAQQPNLEVQQLRKENFDTRLATQQGIIEKFEGKFGISNLDEDKRKALQQKIGTELREMRDPGGNRTTADIIATIPLNVLGSYMERAYRLATDQDIAERERAKGMIEARKNYDAALPSGSSRSIRNDDGVLSAEEKKVANKLGIGEKKYLEQKKKIAEEYN